MIACKKSLLCFKIFSMICQNRKNVTCMFLAQILRADFVICTKSYIKIITARKLMIQHGIIYRNCEVCLYQATFFEKNDSEYLWNVHAINCNLNLTNRSANCVAYICTYKYRQYYNLYQHYEFTFISSYANDWMPKIQAETNNLWWNQSIQIYKLPCCDTNFEILYMLVISEMLIYKLFENDNNNNLIFM